MRWDEPEIDKKYVNPMNVKLVRDSLLLLAVLACSSARGETLRIMTLDEDGLPLPCRVLIRPAGRPCAVPERAVTLMTGNDLWFMSTGNCAVQIPPGEILLRIERGPEFVRIKQKLRVAESTTKTFVLRRWIDMPNRGYKCGENHLHVATQQLGPMLVAEGLDFGSSLTWWRGPDALRPIPAGEGSVRVLKYAGRQVPTSIYDAELEYAWGAAYIQNLPQPMPIKAEPGRPNWDYLRHAARAGAIVHYQGGWSREVLMDALLDCVHTVNVCNNNFAFHRFQPRRRYSNLLGVDGLPDYADTDVGMMRMNTDTYYRLLNCGLRLAAGAGSATGVKQAPVGYNRAYVRLDGDASIDDFYSCLERRQKLCHERPDAVLEHRFGSAPG